LVSGSLTPVQSPTDERHVVEIVLKIEVCGGEDGALARGALPEIEIGDVGQLVAGGERRRRAQCRQQLRQ
jgi:hypothetical protein